MANETLLHYRILEKIGEGGMGVVYKALDTRLDRLVAIKTFPAIDDPKRKRQFIWEARAAAGLRHPNIVVVHEIASDQGIDFIVMEYVPGRPLSELLTHGPLSTEDTLRYSGDIAAALEAAHAAGIVHRDLKPSNILVTPEGSIKLVDFGLARLQRQDADTQSAVHTIAGTCEYMSPEQAQGEDITAQSDIFSFGAVLYEMATGHRAFRGKSAASAMATVLRDDPPRPASLAANVPPALEKIIERCLRKDLRSRFQHIGDVRLALEDVTPVSRGVRRHVPTPWRRGLLYASLAVIPMLAGGLLLSRSSVPEENSAPLPLTSFPGEESAPAWSPDGRQVAFVWTGEKQNNHDIYVLQPGSSQILRLTSDPGSHYDPAWSPDARWIVHEHVAPDDSSHSIDIVSSLGGPPRTLFTASTAVQQPKWTPDGRAVLFRMAHARNQAGEMPGEVWALSIDTGARRQLTWPPAGIPGDMEPAISPNGRTLAFCRKTAWRTAELYLQELRPDLTPVGAPQRVTDLGYAAHPAWDPDGTRLVFEAHREAALWQVDRSGKNVRPVSGLPVDASRPALAKRPGGYTSLAFTNISAEHTILRFSTARGATAAPLELAPSNRSQNHPRYSHDGKRLAFSSTRTGYEEIWVADADGTHPVQVTALRHLLTEVGHWSPDDRTIAFVSQDRGPRQIYLAGSSGGPAVAITNEEGVEFGTGWSRDGSAYYYGSLLTGRREVRKALRGGGPPQQMTVNGGQYGFESRSAVFYYWRPNAGQGAPLMRRDADGDRQVPVILPGGTASVTTVRGGFYYKAANNDVVFFDEATGRSTRVFRHPAMPYNEFTISPDGRWFATDSVAQPRYDLMIMEHFH